MNAALNTFLVSAALLLASSSAYAQETTRRFELHYGATVMELAPGATVKVWLPIAKNNEHQTVDLRSASTPAPMDVGYDEKFGNKMGMFEMKVPETGLLSFNLTYDIERHEATPFGSDKMLNEKEREKFLAANQMVPIDGRPLDLISQVEFSEKPLQIGNQLYNVVDDYMKYDKSKPGYGKGDVLWACDSKTGNCTDFHSLFISLARSRSIPARFEIGFPIPADANGSLGGYHCWAWFFAEEQGWVPVDISEADKHPELKDYYFGRLTKDRVAFTTGRDIPLVGKPEVKLNYFVYPYVEVDGKPLEKEKIKLSFSYSDHTDQ